MAEASDTLIVEDPDVQAGAPTFRGTRILVLPVAQALRRDVGRTDIKVDYGLTDEQLETALAYEAARSCPRH